MIHADRLRISSTTTHYVLDDDGQVLSENTSSGNPIREYISLGDMPVALVDRTGMSPVSYSFTPII